MSCSPALSASASTSGFSRSGKICPDWVPQSSHRYDDKGETAMTNSFRSARRRALSAAAGLLGLGGVALATAQTSMSVSVLEEVVVTAQKFEQKLSETP